VDAPLLGAAADEMRAAGVYRWLGADGRMIVEDGRRTPLRPPSRLANARRIRAASPRRRLPGAIACG